MTRLVRLRYVLAFTTTPCCPDWRTYPSVRDMAPSLLWRDGAAHGWGMDKYRRKGGATGPLCFEHGSWDATEWGLLGDDNNKVYMTGKYSFQSKHFWTKMT